MTNWACSNMGKWLDIEGHNVVELDEWLPTDTSTLAGGLLILGHEHGMRLPRRRSRAGPQLVCCPISRARSHLAISYECGPTSRARRACYA